MTNREMTFADRHAFRSWLSENVRCHEGVFVVFDRFDRNALKRTEAVEEALCFGWIDGVLHKKDADSYSVYFAERSAKSKWSPKNIETVARLGQEGRMTEWGWEKVEVAKTNGSWDHPAVLPAYDEEQTQKLIHAIGEVEPALSNFLKMSRSVQRTYTLMYLDAKTESTRIKRLQTIIQRLNENRKPMG